MEASDLYGLPLERFVPERTTLAKALRGEGDRDEAARVAKLAKPSVAAWAVNQLVRTQRRSVEALFDAGDAVQQAQQDVIAGRGSAVALREAAERERAAASGLLETARGLLSAEGHGLTPATLDRVSETLHAAALQADARRAVRDGCLTRELRHVGLGDGGAGGTLAGRTKQTGPGRTKQPAAARREQKAAEREREQRRKAARAEVAAAERAVKAAARDLRGAEQRRDRAAAAMLEAEEAVSAAQSRVGEASRAHDAAQAALDQI